MAKDEGVAFTASTTESITINRDWSNECARIDIKEFGVSSAQGDLICQAIKTN